MLPQVTPRWQPGLSQPDSDAEHDPSAVTSQVGVLAAKRDAATNAETSSQRCPDRGLGVERCRQAHSVAREFPEPLGLAPNDD